MYTVDHRDEVIELVGVPKPDVGAPLPSVWADDYRLILEYLVSKPDPNWDGSYVNVVSQESPDRNVAIVRFTRPYGHMFGPPNDEAFEGHPLASRGLSPYAVFEVRNSSWIRQLERMNSVHRYHNPTRFLKELRHFIFAFHDSVFECVAGGLEVSMHAGSLLSSVELVLDMLKQDPI